MVDHVPESSSLEQELAAVDQELEQALADLYPPFSQLIGAKLGECYPLVRAALVLTAGFGAPDTAELRGKRIYLGAAIEMLHLALAVHSRLLVPNRTERDQQRSILGSMILAGDYCFSRSAGLAARTDSPVVVEIFANALKTLSEGRLRYLLDDESRSFDENQLLFASGIRAASTLSGLAAHEVAEAVAFSDALAQTLKTESVGPTSLPAIPVRMSAPARQRRWRELCIWLEQSR